MEDRERLYNRLMDILLLLEEGQIGVAKDNLESLTNNILYDTGRY
jgi:hypothetical protein